MDTAIQQVMRGVISCQGVAYSLKVIEIEVVMEECVRVLCQSSLQFCIFVRGFQCTAAST
jgi:hypothetical protein